MLVYAPGQKPELYAPASMGTPGDYPQATNRLLTEADLTNFTASDMKIMRNEIFARHGLIFKTSELRGYFSSRAWYKARFKDVTDKVTEVEKKNIELIVKYEEAYYLNRPINAMIKNLHFLTLPLDLGEVYDESTSLPQGMELPSGFGTADMSPGTFMYGLLPDTTHYYGIVWNGYAGGEEGEEYTTTYLTMLDTKFKPIATVYVTVAPQQHIPDHCVAEDENITSVFNEDLSWRSEFTVLVNCANAVDEESGRRKVVSAGRVRKDGTLEIFEE
jgi:hypothetical protein